ncbi:MAG: hypothetical protein Q9218_001432, partial [Villophora microphyllina]
LKYIDVVYLELTNERTDDKLKRAIPNLDSGVHLLRHPDDKRSDYGRFYIHNGLYDHSANDDDSAHNDNCSICTDGKELLEPMAEASDAIRRLVGAIMGAGLGNLLVYFHIFYIVKLAQLILNVKLKQQRKLLHLFPNIFLDVYIKHKLLNLVAYIFIYNFYVFHIVKLSDILANIFFYVVVVVIHFLVYILPNLFFHVHIFVLSIIVNIQLHSNDIVTHFLIHIFCLVYWAIVRQRKRFDHVHVHVFDFVLDIFASGHTFNFFVYVFNFDVLFVYIYIVFELYVRRLLRDCLRYRNYHTYVYADHGDCDCDRGAGWDPEKEGKEILRKESRGWQGDKRRRKPRAED